MLAINSKCFDKTFLPSNSIPNTWESSTLIQGVPIQTVKLPIYPGKNVTVISETIALNYLLKTYGYNASKEFSDRLDEEIKRRSEDKGSYEQRHITYFHSDDE